MAHAHFGNLADVFKHVALAEIIGGMRPGEYWESHAGDALNAESPTPPPERLHGIHTFLRLAATNDTLRLSTYSRILMQATALDAQSAGALTQKFPGSPFLARFLMPETARRLLFCDTDADSLNSIRASAALRPAGTPESRNNFKGIHGDKIECVQDDGITVLRGAGILLPEQWTASTLAFIDPDDMDAPTDSGISPLQLACELATRGIVTVLWYGFKDDAHRANCLRNIQDFLQKSRLNSRAQRFEGALKAPAEPAPLAPPTQWGFGLLALNLPSDLSGRINIKLRALETAYEKSELSPHAPGSGAWKLTHAAM